MLDEEEKKDLEAARLSLYLIKTEKEDQILFGSKNLADPSEREVQFDFVDSYFPSRFFTTFSMNGREKFVL